MKAADTTTGSSKETDPLTIQILLGRIDEQSKRIDSLNDQIRDLQAGREMLVKEFREEHRETREEMKICWAEVNKKQEAISQTRKDLSELSLQVSQHIRDTGQEFSDIKAKMEEAPGAYRKSFPMACPLRKRRRSIMFWSRGTKGSRALPLTWALPCAGRSNRPGGTMNKGFSGFLESPFF